MAPLVTERAYTQFNFEFYLLYSFYSMTEYSTKFNTIINEYILLFDRMTEYFYKNLMILLKDYL